MSSQKLLSLIDSSASLSPEDKGALAHAVPDMSPKEIKLTEKTLLSEIKQLQKIETSYVKRKRSLIETYKKTVKTLKKWAFKRGEQLEKENESDYTEHLFDDV